MKGLVRSILAEPRQDAERSRWDVVFVLVTVFGIVQSDVGPAMSLTIVIPLAIVVWFRKAIPMGACMVGLAISFLAAQTAAFGSDVSGLGLLIVIYGLARWAAGRHVLLGFAAVLVIGPSISSITADATAEGPLVARIVAPLIGWMIESTVWLVPFVIGLVVRNRAGSHARDVRDARSKERGEFARELHDTVAHHVSAIAIAAQAGQAVGATRPDAAVEALAAIEEEATRTLDEMRNMVRALRTADDTADLAPAAGLRQIESLAEPDGSPEVVVELAGDLETLSPSVEASLFRIVQEATTNARRHARDAQRIEITVEADESDVHLVVADDGRKSVTNDRSAGFGLVGMAERVALLNGEFLAAPGRERGWVVEATLPRSGVPT